ncbi:MAG: hypothetical protein ACI9H8_001020 [Lysobacterales bacterium]|jgi:hypothetical protein
MTFFPNLSTLLRVSCLLAAVLLVACTSTPVKNNGLEFRAQSRWDAMLANDFAKAYSYSSPGYRSSVSERDFEIEFRLRKVFYTSSQYLDHVCEGDACTVRMTVGYTVVGALRGVAEWKSKTPVEEKWVHIDGQWWFYPQN